MTCCYNSINLLKISSQKTPHNSPIRPIDGVSFVPSNSDILSQCLQYCVKLDCILTTLHCIWLSKALANERGHYLCNVFSHWIRLCSGIDRKRAQYANLLVAIIITVIRLSYPNNTVGERTVTLKINARCSITQTLTGQSIVWWWHARKMVMIYFKRI